MDGKYLRVTVLPGPRAPIISVKAKTQGPARGSPNGDQTYWDHLKKIKKRSANFAEISAASAPGHASARESLHATRNNQTASAVVRCRACGQEVDAWCDWLLGVVRSAEGTSS